MGETTGIDWTDSTWGPWRGCHKVSPGCRECYMFREQKRYGRDPNVVVRAKPATFNAPIRWARKLAQSGAARKLVFVCSWSDFWIAEADPWRAEAWEIIRRTPHLTYQIVTKRIERVAEVGLPWGDGEPWPNVWGIVSVENQETADERVGLLLQTNFAVRGVSYEPALAPVNFSWLAHDVGPILVRLNALTGQALRVDTRRPVDSQMVGAVFPRLDWIIMGVESGDGHQVGRDMIDPLSGVSIYTDVAREVAGQCREHGVAFFQKQMPVGGRVSHEPMDWAAEDRVREFPA